MASTVGKVISCKAVVLKEFKKPVCIETIEVDVPQKKEVRIKMVAVGVCQSDHIVQQGKDSSQLLPCVLGHEGAGIIESVGEGVDSVKPGDKVLTVFIANCKKCKVCLGNRSNLCLDTWGSKGAASPIARNVGYDGKSRFRLNGNPLYHMAGASSFSEYVVIPESSCVKVNPKAPLDKVCLLACGFSTGYGSAANAVDILPGDSTAVWGLGGVGLAAVVGCKDKGATRIIGIDINNAKEKFAKKLGVTDFINSKEVTEPLPDIIKTMTQGGVDVALVCIPSAMAMEAAIHSTNIGGTMVVVGFGDNSPFPVTAAEMLGSRKIKGASLGDYKPRTDLPKLVDHYLEGKLPLDDFVTHTFRLDQIHEAFENLLSGNSIRSVVLM